MDSIAILTRLLEAWRELSKEEQIAIGRDDWPGVSRAQQSKAALQTEIIELGTTLSQFDDESALGGLKRELLRLESQNGLLLDQKRQSTGIHLLEITGTLRRLRLTRRYCRQPARANWVSFS
jgi:hypothetical protein